MSAAYAFWLSAPGRGEIRPVSLPEPRQGDVLVRTLRSGVSRGTETLVFRGGVPPTQYAAMRAPFQEGDFPGPVKYGYLSVGAVERGPAELLGRTVFCLYPHQTEYVVPAGAVTLVPDGVPPARAVLAGTVETAVNALWDAAPLVGDRVTVVGAGMVGCCVARLLQPVPGDRRSRSWTSILAARRSRPHSGSSSPYRPTPPTAATSSSMPARPRPGSSCRSTCSHRRARSSTSAGTATARCSCRWAARFIRAACASAPARWARSLRLAADDVRTADRLALALELLRDPAFDALVTGQSHFRELPEVMARLAEGSLPALCHTITYDED